MNGIRHYKRCDKGVLEPDEEPDVTVLFKLRTRDIDDERNSAATVANPHSTYSTKLM